MALATTKWNDVCATSPVPGQTISAGLLRAIRDSFGMSDRLRLSPSSIPSFGMSQRCHFRTSASAPAQHHL
jgi:hypothetical protein